MSSDNSEAAIVCDLMFPIVKPLSDKIVFISSNVFSFSTNILNKKSLLEFSILKDAKPAPNLLPRNLTHSIPSTAI